MSKEEQHKRMHSSALTNSVRRKFKPVILSSTDDSSSEDSLIENPECTPVAKLVFEAPRTFPIEKTLKQYNAVGDSTEREVNTAASSGSEDVRRTVSKAKPRRISSSSETSDNELSSSPALTRRLFASPAVEECIEKVSSKSVDDNSTGNEITKVGDMVENSLTLKSVKKKADFGTKSIPSKSRPVFSSSGIYTPKPRPCPNSTSKRCLPNLMGSASTRKVGKVTPYKLSGRKIKPVVLTSDEDTSSDELPIVTQVENSSKELQKQVTKLSFLKSLSPTVPDAQAYVGALEFKRNFDGTRVKLAKLLYRLFNEKIFSNKLPADITLDWSDGLTSTAGYYSKRDVKICLSTKILTSPDKLRDTLLHEMCHAAVDLISQAKEVHGPLWQTWALRCGIIFPDIKIPDRCHTYAIDFKYVYKCTGCDKSFGRNKQSIDLNLKRCGQCKSKLVLVC